jgi:hypothetical protein
MARASHSAARGISPETEDDKAGAGRITEPTPLSSAENTDVAVIGAPGQQRIASRRSGRRRRSGPGTPLEAGLKQASTGPTRDAWFATVAAVASATRR